MYTITCIINPFSDICFLVICGTFLSIHYALTVWPFGDILCRIVQYLLYVTCYVTVYTLVAVSGIRYLTVIYGHRARFIRNKRNILILILVIWIVFLLAKIPVLTVHSVSYNEKINRTECIINGRNYAQNLFASFFAFAYVIPLLVIATLYMLILRHMKQERDNAVHHSPGSEERNRYVTKMIILLVVIFAVCWLPLHIHLLVAYYGHAPTNPIYYPFLILWHCMAFGNSMLNPVIYNLVSTDFRKSFKEVMCCQKGYPVEDGSV